MSACSSAAYGVVRGEVYQHGPGQRISGDVGHGLLRRCRLPLGKVGQPATFSFFTGQACQTPRADAVRIEDEAGAVDHCGNPQGKRRAVDPREQRGEGAADLAEPEQHDFHALGPDHRPAGDAGKLKGRMDPALRFRGIRGRYHD